MDLKEELEKILIEFVESEDLTYDWAIQEIEAAISLTYISKEEHEKALEQGLKEFAENPFQGMMFDSSMKTTMELRRIHEFILLAMRNFIKAKYKNKS